MNASGDLKALLPGGWGTEAKGVSLLPARAAQVTAQLDPNFPPRWSFKQQGISYWEAPVESAASLGVNKSILAPESLRKGVRQARSNFLVKLSQKTLLHLFS